MLEEQEKAMPDKLYIVLHLYKNAGRTLNRNFQCNFSSEAWLPLYAGPLRLDKVGAVGGLAFPGWDAQRVNDHVARHTSEKTRCLFGHMAYPGIHHLVNSPARDEARYIIFLRDPVERCISLYYYLKNRAGSKWHDAIIENNWSLEQWFEKTDDLRRLDGQIRHLLLGSYDEVLTETELAREHLEEGKRRLRQFWFVGLTESFDEDSHYLYGKLGFLRYHPQPRMNVSPNKQAVPAATRQFIAERNALDMELYQFARELRAQYIEKHPWNFAFNTSKARLTRSLYSGLSSVVRCSAQGSHSKPSDADGE